MSGVVKARNSQGQLHLDSEVTYATSSALVEPLSPNLPPSHDRTNHQKHTDRTLFTTPSELTLNKANFKKA